MSVSDPMHHGWHSITMHNRFIFERAKKQREDKFDASLRKRQATAEKVAARRMRMVRAQEGGIA